jgi:hypothetical protein
MVAVRWYLHYALSHRDVEELLAERDPGRSRDGLPVSAALYIVVDRRGGAVLPACAK